MRYRSLSIFKRGRSKSVTSPRPTPPTSPRKFQTATNAKSQRAASIAAQKRKKYPKLPALLPTLAQEAELAQLLDGGSTRVNVERVMREKAVARGATVHRDGTVEGVSVAVKDEHGVWWEDAEEREEFAHLLGGADGGAGASPPAQWVEFHSPGVSPMKQDGDEERRGSVSTVSSASSADSELDPRYRVLPPPDSVDDLALFGFASSDSIARPGPGHSILALPARPRRAAKHLRRPALLCDVSVSLPASPKSPKSPSRASARPKGRARRRPMPLTLSPPSPAGRRAANGQHVLDARDGFLGDSFDPAPKTAPLPVARAQAEDAVTATKTISHKPSVWKLLRKVKA
jgi:hypothetical protein